MVSAQEMVKIKGISVDNLRNQMEGVSVNYQNQGQQSETITTDRNGIYQIDVPLLDDGENVIIQKVRVILDEENINVINFLRQYEYFKLLII